MKVPVLTIGIAVVTLGVVVAAVDVSVAAHAMERSAAKRVSADAPASLVMAPIYGSDASITYGTATEKTGR